MIFVLFNFYLRFKGTKRARIGDDDEKGTRRVKVCGDEKKGPKRRFVVWALGVCARRVMVGGSNENVWALGMGFFFFAFFLYDF
jgi:hypothetical protein